MLKCKHLKVRVRAPRATVMRRRELALLPVLPLVVDPIHLLVEMQVLQGAEIKDREEEEEKGQGDDEEREEDEQPPPPLETLGKRIQGRNPRGEGSLLSR
jgi:hypothetical protein